MGIAPQIEVSSLGMADSLILMVLALVVFGPRRLPQIGKQLGKLMYEFRKASNDFKFQMEEELRNAEEADRRKKEDEQRKALTVDAAAEPVSATADVAAMQTQTPDSPYGRETLYPETAEEQAQAEDAAKADEGELQIKPPSTGETVAAERPGSVKVEAVEQAEPAAEAAEMQAESAEKSAPAQTNSAATEAVSHNG